MPVYDLPMRNDASAPRFDEDKPCELANYFEELEDLFERHRVSDAADRKRSAVRYVSVDVRELWQYATAWDDPRRSYEDFKAEVYALYPEATDTFRYTAWDLEALVNEQAQREMQSTEDLHAFYRKFIVISTFLVKRNRLSTLEQARWFLGAFSGNQAGHLRQRLELKHPDAHINDIPDFVDIFEEAQLVLLRQLYSAQATGATAPEAPRHPEKRNATTARAPNAAPLTVAPSTPTNFSSRPAPMAAPLTPDTATGPCQKGSTAPTAISAAASAPRATRGPLSDYPPMMEHPSSQGSTSSDREHRKRGAKGCNHTSTVGNLSTNRWVATSTRRHVFKMILVERKVKALLNKLTMRRFDLISDQIIAWANKSEGEKDGRTLIQVIKLVFEKATDEAMFSEMYARLCRKMMEQISPKVQDYGVKNAEGKPFAGGQLFRKYLLNRCQEDFERGWVAKETTTAAAASKATEDQAVKEVNEKTKSGGEFGLYSDEYYTAAKAKRRGLGLIRFIGELFKLQMLTERIMHECIKKLLVNVENPEEGEIESLCELLTTVGSLLDTPKARAHLDVYFSRMRGLTKNKNVSARMIFMLQDVIELRERNWVPYDTIAAPTTITSTQPKAGNLTQFGNIGKATPITFGPSSIFASKKGDPKNRDLSMSRIPSTSSNMLSMLQSSDAALEPPISESNWLPWRKPSVDGAGGPPEPAPQRRKVQLLPRTRPFGEESKMSTPSVSEAGPNDETSGGGGTPAMAAMSEEDLKTKIEKDVKEFFNIRMLDEAGSYFSSLPTARRCRLVETLVMKSIELKEPDVKLVGDLFVRVRENDLCSPDVFEEGFNRLAELLDDLADDIPKAWSYFAILLKGSGLDQDEERRRRIGEKTMNPDKLDRLL